MSEQSLREALAEQLYGEVWSEKPWSEATPQEKALCYKAAQRFEQIIAEHVPRPLLDREAVAARLLYEEGSEWAEGTRRHYELADAVMELARPMPTREQLAEVLWKYRQKAFPQAVDWDGVHSVSRTAMLERADAVLALLNGTEA